MAKIKAQETQQRNSLLKKLKIKITGDIHTPILTNFTKMKNYINTDLLNAVNKSGYVKPTPI